MSPRHLIWALALWPAGASASDWSLSLSGGIATVAGEGGQPFASATIYRYVGAGFVRAGATWFDGEGDPDVAEPLPAQTRQVTFGGGYQAGRILLDAYVTLGSRDFTPPGPDRTNGRIVRAETDGGLFTLGGSVTLDAPVGDRWLVAPFLSLSYSEVDTARTLVPQAGDPVIVKSRESGLTGIAGLSAERLWEGGSLGVYLAGAATSNRASINRQGSGLLAARTPQLIRAEDEKDGWVEYGLSGSIRLSDALTLDAALVRTAGFSRGETTSASAGIGIRF
ncbi:MAG: autotransporter domain-containing protein [Sphingomonas sp.]|nr:autotransporter domain-containing protein [Sphingomonas sp.]